MILCDFFLKTIYTVFAALRKLDMGHHCHLTLISDRFTQLFCRLCACCLIICSAICIHQIVIALHTGIQYHNRNSIFLCRLELCLAGTHINCCQTYHRRILRQYHIQDIDLIIDTAFIFRSLNRTGDRIVTLVSQIFIQIQNSLFHSFFRCFPVIRVCVLDHRGDSAAFFHTQTVHRCIINIQAALFRNLCFFFIRIFLGILLILFFLILFVQFVFILCRFFFRRFVAFVLCFMSLIFRHPVCYYCCISTPAKHQHRCHYGY